jgi:hypothetical protein
MKLKQGVFRIIIIIVFLYLKQLILVAQIKPYVMSNNNSLNSVMDSIIVQKYLKIDNEDLSIAFVLKVDSIGEIHSAHIRQSKNLKFEYYYEICSELENNINVKFIFDKYKIPGDKYARCIYRYRSNRDSIPSHGHVLPRR